MTRIGGTRGRRLARALATFLLAVACGRRDATDAARRAARPLAIVHAIVVDPAREPRRDTTILVRGTRITAVGPSAEVDVPADAMIQDASDRFVVPGLWDAHVHLSQLGAPAIPLLVANGVTSVRDMGSVLADVERWKRDRARGALVPRILSPGPKLEGASSRLAAALESAFASPDQRYLATTAAAREAVDDLKSRGVDFIKVHNGLSRRVFEAIADECRKTGLFFAGHVQPGVGAMAAAAAGQRTIEHGRGMLPCSQEDRGRIGSDPALARLAWWCAPPGQETEVLATLARAGTWFTPTLTSWRGNAMSGDPELPRLLAGLFGHERVWPGLERHWDAMTGPVPSPLERDFLSRFGPLAAAADRAGVHLLAGTDAGDPYVVPGFALHDELELLVRAGIPPARALASATTEPARAFGLDDEVGAIRSGLAADLVVLGRDPTKDIRNTRLIEAVVLNGRWISRGELDAMLGPPR